MPKMDGLECAAALLALDPAARILLVTGSALQGSRLRIAKSHTVGVVQKPFRLVELSEAVASALSATSSDPHRPAG